MSDHRREQQRGGKTGQHRLTGRQGVARLSQWRPICRTAAMAGLAALLLLSMAGTGVFAQERYRVQNGDTIDSIASTFGVDPQAILAASWIPDPSNLQSGQVIVIPDPGQSPSAAAQDAAAHEGQSPWVSTVYTVQSGDTIENIAYKFGVTKQEIADFNGLSDPNLLDVGQRLLIPPPDDGASTGGSGPVHADVLVAGNGSLVPGVPFYKQEHNLSCEYAAAHIATGAFGNAIPEQNFIDNIGEALNPHKGYRGNIDGQWGGITDYGVYPEAMQGVLQAWGFSDDIFYSEGDPSQLKAEIDAGHPVLVWLGLWGDDAQVLHDDGTYTVAAGDHVMVAYGYDNGGVYLSDPASASSKYFDWNTFTSMWTVLDGMSMAIYYAS